MSVTNTTNRTLSDVINAMTPEARIPALRAVAHSAMARAIGAIRQKVRNDAYLARNEENPAGSLDERNAQDENDRARDEVRKAMGFTADADPIAQASLFHAVYEEANLDLGQLIRRGEIRGYDRWKDTLSVNAMLEYMTRNAQSLDKNIAEQLAKIVKTDVAHIVKIHELQAQQEREKLIEATPEIISTFEGFGDNGYDNAMDDLSKLDQHQMAVTVITKMEKARDKVIADVLRSKKMTELGSIPLIEDGMAQITAWVDDFEVRYGDELREALEAGRNLKTLEESKKAA